MLPAVLLFPLPSSVTTNHPQPPDPTSPASTSIRAAVEFTLRPPTWADVPAMFEMQSDSAANDMAGVKPRTREVFEARWREILADPAINSRLIEIPSAHGDGSLEIAGSVSVFQSEGKDMLGYWIARAHWSNGLASRGVAAFLKLEPRRPLVATAALANIRSLRVLEKSGFRLVRTYKGEETDRYYSREVCEFVLETGGHDLADTVAVLERTPRVLEALLRGLPTAWTHHNYGEKTWCAYEVVGHLIGAERDDWMPRLRRILESGESKPFNPFPHDTTVKPDPDVPLEKLLDEFAHLRQENLRELAATNPTPVMLCRIGMHPTLGRVTAGQLLATWAVHDLHHLRQVALAMAWQYRDTVGPWRAYLNTLSRYG